MAKNIKPTYDQDTIILKDKIYVPADSLDAQEVENRYTHYMYDQKTCKKCDNYSNRHNWICDNCPAFHGIVSTCNSVYKNEIDYVGIPLGDRTKFEDRFGVNIEDYEVIDKRVSNKFDYHIKMRKSFKLYGYQEEAARAWWKYKHGLIIAPPRSGKTPTMLFMAVKLGYRVLLLANQHDFLQQFVEHIEEFTNLPKLERETGVKLYGFPKKMEDFDTLQIAVSTYQQFIGKYGKKRFEKARTQFGSLFIDEVHRANANSFASVVNSWPARIRMGVTATDKRKDCFVAGTPVLMSDGSTVPIEQVKSGDTVAAYDTILSEYTIKPVAETHVRPTSDLVRIVHEEGEFVCTPDHEIWSETRGEYVYAANLTCDDELML